MVQTRFSRRKFLVSAGALGAGTMVPALARAQVPCVTNDPLSGESLYRTVEKYTSWDHHRSGTTNDLETSAWIREKLRAAGLDVDYHEWPMRVFDLIRCYVKFDGMTFDGFPEWFPTATGPTPIEAPLAVLERDRPLLELPWGNEPDLPLSDLRGKIWVTETDPRREVLSPALKQQIDAAGRAGALGAVVLVHHASRELPGRNSPRQYSDGPWCSIPLVGVAIKHADELYAAARAGKTGRLLIDGIDRQGFARNVVGHAGKGKDVIIISTPSSGLYRCGAERGPGVAHLIGIARWLRGRDPKVRYLFSTNSGHEIGGRGAALAEEYAPPPGEVKCWLHLGSGVGTWRYEDTPVGPMKVYRRGGIKNFVSNEKFVDILRESFAHIPDLEPRAGSATGNGALDVSPAVHWFPPVDGGLYTRPLTGEMVGELRRYDAAGYPSWGFFGSNMHKHAISDGPEQTAPEILEPLARGIATALTKIELM
jgi:hypothetical protein